jgi:hypothetical protein
MDTRLLGGPSVNPLLGIIRKASRDAAHHATWFHAERAGNPGWSSPQPTDPMDKYFRSKS